MAVVNGVFVFFGFFPNFFVSVQILRLCFLSFILQEDLNNIKGGTNKKNDSLIDINVSGKCTNNGNMSSTLSHLKETATNNDHGDNNDNNGINSTQIGSKIKNVVSTLFFAEEILASGN